VEKLLREQGDKVSADERKKVEDALNELREALKGEDNERTSRAIDALQQASYRLSEEMYKATAEGAAAGAAPGTPGSAPDGQTKPSEDVIDAEYKPTQ
jgi:molecular chaperone DnaK